MWGSRRRPPAAPVPPAGSRRTAAAPAGRYRPISERTRLETGAERDTSGYTCQLRERGRGQASENKRGHTWKRGKAKLRDVRKRTVNKPKQASSWKEQVGKRVDLTECYREGQMTFGRVRSYFGRGQAIQRSQLFACNAIDTELKLSIGWMGSIHGFRSFGRAMAPGPLDSPR